MTTVPAAAGEALIGPFGPARGRVYLSIATGTGGTAAAEAAVAAVAMVIAERRVLMEGPVNFRDIGGYTGHDGRAVRWGLVFRSDALLLSDRDVEVFAGLGIRTVYDLRSSMERDSIPNRLPDERRPEVVVVPLVSEDPAANPLEAIEAGDGENFLEQLYIHILERSAANFGRVLAGLAQAERLPAVYHCAAGKDRTGMVSAVLLSILGVPTSSTTTS